MRFDNDRMGLARTLADAVRLLEPDFPPYDAVALHRAERRLRSFPERMRARRQENGGLRAAVSQFIQSRLQAELYDYQEEIMDFNRLLLDRLVAGTEEARGRKPSLLYVTHFDVLAYNGGAARVLGLSNQLARTYDVSILSLVGPRRRPDIIKLGPHRRIYCVPVSPAFEERRRTMLPQYGTAAYALALAQHADLIPGLGYWMSKLGKAASVCILNQPYLINLVRQKAPQTCLVYDIPEVNRLHIRRMVGERDGLEKALKLQREREEAAVTQAACINVVSLEDGQELARHLGSHIEGKLRLLPNGIDTSQVLFSSPSQAVALGAACGLQQPILPFIGMPNYPPNNFAIEKILAMAPGFPEHIFVIIGMKWQEYPPGASLPPNVVFTGRISEREKSALLALAALALAPLGPDSGSSLKIPEYLAHGKILVSTLHGLRGYPELAEHCRVVALNDFEAALKQTMDNMAADHERFDRRAREAVSAVEAHLDWKVTAGQFMADLDPLIPSPTRR